MATQNHENNYVLGKGEVYFGRFGADVTEHTGERYIGNTPEFNLTIESEKLDHFSADRGIREKDKSVILEVSRSGTMVCDNIDYENLALFFFGSTEVLTVAQATVTDEQLGEVKAGHHYQLGETALNPSGARNIVYPGVVGPPDTTFVLKIDRRYSGRTACRAAAADSNGPGGRGRDCSGRRGAGAGRATRAGARDRR
jgi:hypothetical protein